MEYSFNGVKFAVGDRVRLDRTTKSHDPNGMGEGVEWINSWTDAMDGFVGREGEITSIDKYGVEVSGFSYYAFPINVLTNLSRKPANGVDAKGNLLHFGPDDLKLFQRVKTKGGYEGVVTTDRWGKHVITYIAFEDAVRPSGWDNVMFEDGPNSSIRGNNIIEVYDRPENDGDLLTAGKFGELVWQRADVKKLRAIQQADAEVEAAKAAFEAAQAARKALSK